MITLAAAAAEPPRTWAGIWALLLGYVGFRLVVFFWRKWREATPTPPALGAGSRPKVQATVGSDTDDTTAEPGWWGRIVERNGIRYRQAKQVLTTGSTALPDDEPEERDELDLALEAREDEGEVVEKLDDYIRRALDVRAPYNHIVRIVVKEYGVSESTAKRRIREIREARAAQ